MESKKPTFALFFGHRGPFSPEVMAGARKELPVILKSWGYDSIMLDTNATPHGAVEGTKDGRVYAEFLRQNRGKFDGIILCLPNFGDENGAAEAMKGAGVPILIQAYPDDWTESTCMPRRDAFCGKLSVMDVFGQCEIPFTALKPHVVNPNSDRFKDNVEYFDKVCRVVGGLTNLTVGGIGARTTPFKTVRIDELTLQRHGIDSVTIDLSELFERMKAQVETDDAYHAKTEVLKGLATWDDVPAKAVDTLTRLAVAIDAIIEDYELDALGLRCWTELQAYCGISPCVVLGDLNERGIAAACEVDLGNAIFMRALSKASGNAPACLDWNNNYGDDDDKCNLFHCGPVPSSLMTGKGKICDHELICRFLGVGIGYGCNTGRIAPCDMTFGSLTTSNGKIKAYVGEGKITNDPIPADFFGCAGIAHIKGLQDVMLHIGRNGHRHHVSLTSGLVLEPIKEALDRYLGFEVAVPQTEGA